MKTWREVCGGCGLAASHGLECPALKCSDSLDPIWKVLANFETTLKENEEFLMRSCGSKTLNEEIKISAYKQTVYVFAEDFLMAVKKMRRENYDSDPLEEIKVVLKEYQERFPKTVTVDNKGGIEVAIYFLNKFINAAKKAVEGK